MIQAKEYGLWNEDQSIWQTASKDMLGGCFGYLDGSELLNTVELVCRKWRNCSQVSLNLSSSTSLSELKDR
jgi:hypothetical protein